MSTTWLPCGDYHQNYQQDHAWFQTKFIKGKMILLFFILFIGLPLVSDSYMFSVWNIVSGSAVSLPWGMLHLLLWGHTPAPC